MDALPEYSGSGREKLVLFLHPAQLGKPRPLRGITGWEVLPALSCLGEIDMGKLKLFLSPLSVGATSDFILLQ